MDRARDLEILTIFRWVVVCQEIRKRGKKVLWEGEEAAMAGDGDRELPRREEEAVVAVAAAMEGISGSGAIPGDDGVVGEDLAAVVEAGENAVVVESASGGTAAVGDLGDSEAVRGGDGGLATSSRDMMSSEREVSGSGGGATGSGGGAMGTPSTPTVEELLAAAEWASGERREGAGGEAMTAGRVAATPILRAMAVEPRGGDSGIGASHLVLFAKAVGHTGRPWPRRWDWRGAEGCEDHGGSDLGAVVRSAAQWCGGDGSGYRRTKDIYGHGGSGHSLQYFRELPRRVRELVEETGFGPFIQLLTAVRVERVVMTALAERWWNTTNTFHFRFGEMTVTPLDLAAITGLRVGGEPIPFDPSIDLDDAALEWFLGRVPRHSGGVAEYGQFRKYWDHEPADDTKAAQMARAYLLYLFRASLFPLRRSRVHLSYLAGLVDLRQAGRFDWGGAALCTLYCFLGAASRGVRDTIGGYWRVIEVCLNATALSCFD
ncbi:hypothetical protein RHMOL_Rhmol13G0173600 [Rhododendron molle]|uniref:Uncharacterized protein n=1 Tax=Rhododendron molle TaxID=49168 RepID=A0ACC0L8V8_RHOML|nr:hypothetical protein RHMOL_Rhmol13G0173600 [Rhododendron molle]